MDTKQRLELILYKRVANAFPGNWESIFRGAGEEFFELREYDFGDDFRDIDWWSYAETGELYVRENEALRELKIHVFLDVSQPMFFHKKPEIIDTFLAVLGQAALQSRHPLGFVGFGDSIETYFPSRVGKEQFAQVADWWVNCEPQSESSSFEELYQFVASQVPARSLVFLVSDFLRDPYEEPILDLSDKHDVIPVIIRDPYERELHVLGEFPVSSYGSLEQDVILLGSKELEKYKKIMEENLKQAQERLTGLDLDVLFLDSPDPKVCWDRLQDLFLARKVGRR